MFHKQKHQSGNVLIITLFIIIVMGYLASSLFRVNFSNQSSLTREFLGTQAWFIAQSGSDWALTQVYSLDTPISVATACGNINSGTIPASLALGTNCRTPTVSCTDIGSLDTGAAIETLYRITTVASCGREELLIERQQEVWVREIE